MKTILSLLIILALTATHAQEVFKDGKKYGLSMYGDDPAKNSGDSLLFRAEYDQIESLYYGEDFACKGLKGDEWSFLTPNKLVNQQRYEWIIVSEAYPEYAVAYREGYIDVVRLGVVDFLIRGVKAELLQVYGYFENDELLMTNSAKEFYGLINIELKKEILKCEYTKIYANEDLPGTIVAQKDGSTFLYDMKGELIFKLETLSDITDIYEHDAVHNGYAIMAESKKGTKTGFYYPEHKWFIEPIYDGINFIEDDPAVAVVESDGLKGLYFEGKQLLPCEYLEIQKGDRQGTLAIVTTKKGNFYLFPDGNLKPKTE